MWARVAVAGVTGVLLVGGCAADRELADRDSIRQFEVSAWDPSDAHPCDLVSDPTARELRILDQEGSGSAQSDANCFYTNRVDASVDVRVETHEERDAVAGVIEAAFSGREGQTYVHVEGYPGVTTQFPDSCNLSVAVSDDHSVYVQVSADEACERAVEVARVVVAHASAG
ncbi:DUF3558 family protein [Nocardiopsis sp. NPDC007018]|uniref:DUF3558 family protein n=1 Tax=Nocardiopsis sp. NPDC007018 TaxID=3155721 RepID=UPI003403143C